MAEKPKAQPANTLRSNVVLFISTILTIGSLIGAFIAVDSRYALAEDFRNYKSDTQTQLKNYQQDNQFGVLEIRRQSLEDKIFELSARKGTRSYTSVDEALLIRYTEQLANVNARQQQLAPNGASVKWGAIVLPNTTNRLPKM